LRDGICPNSAILIDRSKGGEEKESFFDARQEGRREDIERVYAVLFTEWQIMGRPSQLRSAVTMKVVGTCRAILHTMMVAHRCKQQHVPSPCTYLHLVPFCYPSSISLIAPVGIPPSHLLLTVCLSSRVRDICLLFISRCAQFVCVFSRG